MSKTFDHLVTLTATLRSEQECPWDKRQTADSLKTYLLEEAYEVIDAIDSRNPSSLKEELGDLLLQVILHAQIAGEDGAFGIDDVIAGLSAKLIRRHPHVFGDDDVNDSREVSRRWEEIKRAEKPEGNDTQILGDIPRAMPALLRAEKLQKRASKTGFDWVSVEHVWAKLEEELTELREAHNDLPVRERTQTEEPTERSGGDTVKRVEEELGDVLFTIVNLSRFLEVHPEEALKKANDRFSRRFSYLDAKAAQEGTRLQDMALEDMDRLWEEAKRRLASLEE